LQQAVVQINARLAQRGCNIVPGFGLVVGKGDHGDIHGATLSAPAPRHHRHLIHSTEKFRAETLPSLCFKYSRAERILPFARHHPVAMARKR
jgi:hypothetical protein